MEMTGEDFYKLYIQSGINGVLDAIQSHTAECVAEAVNDHGIDWREVKKEFGDVGVYGVAILACFPGGEFEKYDSLVKFIQMPIVTKTDEELRFAISEKTGMTLVQLDRYSRPTLEAMAKDLGISTTVEE